MQFIPKKVITIPFRLHESIINVLCDCAPIENKK